MLRRLESFVHCSSCFLYILLVFVKCTGKNMHTFKLQIFKNSENGIGLLPTSGNYSRTPEIETEDFSQSHAGLNLSQFQPFFYVQT